MYRPAPRSWLTIACAALFACSPTGPSDFLEVSLRPGGDSVTSGAPGVAEVEVTNRGPEQIELEAETCPPRIRVFDLLGNRIEQPPLMCPLRLTAPVVLAPGETYVYEQGWLAQDEDGTSLPPGAYRIQAWVVPVGGGPVPTNRVTVSVRAPS